MSCHIVQVVARLNIGGVAGQVLLAAERLTPPDFTCTVVCGRIGPNEGDMSYLAAQKGITPTLVPELGRALSPLRDPVALVKLWRLFRRIRPDIVHTHTAKAGFLGRLAARMAGVPAVVHTFHGHVFHGYFSPAQTRLFIALERLGARLSDRIVTLTPQLKDEIANAYRIAPAEKFAIIPLGLELAPFSQPPGPSGALRAELGLPRDVPLVGAVGRLVPVKALDLLLRAAARLQGVHVVLVGDGPCRPDLEAEAAALGIAERVHFTGWRRDLPAIYSDLHVLALPSRNEGMPVSIIEAQAARVPVVAAAVGGVPDLITPGETGLLFPSGDTVALSEAIRRLVQSPALAAYLAGNAHAAALARFDPARLANDLAALYRELMEAREA